MSTPLTAARDRRPEADAATIVFRRDMTIVMADRSAGRLLGRPAVDLVGIPAGCVLQQTADLSLYGLLLSEPDPSGLSPQRAVELDLLGVHAAAGPFPLRATVTEGRFLGHRIFMAVLVPTGRRRRDPRLVPMDGGKARGDQYSR